MLDPTEYELKAFEAAGQAAGEYLDSIHKTDLAQLSEEEWRTFCRTMCSAYSDALLNISSELKIMSAILADKASGPQEPPM